MNDNESTNAEARKLVAEISTYIAHAKEAISKGVLVDLAGLDAQIQLLCEEVIRMPVGESRYFREILQELSDDLGGLRDVLTATRDEVREELEALNKRQKAAHAYKNTEVAEAKQPQDIQHPTDEE